MVIKPDVACSFPTWTGGDDEGACCCCLFVVVVVVVVAAAVIVVHVAMDVVSMIRLLVGLVVVFLCWLLG